MSLGKLGVITSFPKQSCTLHCIMLLKPPLKHVKYHTVKVPVLTEPRLLLWRSIARSATSAYSVGQNPWSTPWRRLGLFRLRHHPAILVAALAGHAGGFLLGHETDFGGRSESR